MGYRKQKGKKIILKTDIGGNVDQGELWAIIDSVGIDDEEDMNNLLEDNDTKFELMTDDAMKALSKDENSNEIPLVTSNSL